MTIIPYVNDIRQYVKENPHANIQRAMNPTVGNEFYMSMVMELDAHIGDVHNASKMIVEDYNMCSNVDCTNVVYSEEIDNIIKSYIQRYHENIHNDFIEYFNNTSQLKNDIKEYSLNVLKKLI